MYMLLSSCTRNYIQNKLIAMKKNNGDPSINNKRFLTIFVCHANTKLKVEAVTENIRYLNFENNDIIVINSKDTGFDKNKITANILDYIEVDNDINTLDIGKFVYVIENRDISKYDFVVFINDSIVLRNSINHFYNIMVKKDVELYGYNSSSEIKYHYQSYLYGIKTSSVNKLVDYFNTNKHLLDGWLSVVTIIELNLVDIFLTRDCFLDVAIMPENINKNLAKGNKDLHHILLVTKLFPIVKVKTM